LQIITFCAIGLIIHTYNKLLARERSVAMSVTHNYQARESLMCARLKDGADWINFTQ